MRQVNLGCRAAAVGRKVEGVGGVWLYLQVGRKGERFLEAVLPCAAFKCDCAGDVRENPAGSGNAGVGAVVNVDKRKCPTGCKHSDR